MVSVAERITANGDATKAPLLSISSSGAGGHHTVGPSEFSFFAPALKTRKRVDEPKMNLFFLGTVIGDLAPRRITQPNHVPLSRTYIVDHLFDQCTWKQPRFWVARPVLRIVRSGRWNTR